MSERQIPRWRIYAVALVILAELAHRAWEHFHGGIRSHHILNRADLPAISNALGLLLLPALAWFLSGRVQRRMARHADAGAGDATTRLPASVVVGFVGALLFGALLAGSFATGHQTVTSYVFQSVIVLALLLPIYRAECVLGFVLGMTFTFGAVLPTAVGSVIAALSAAMHLIVYPLIVRFWNWAIRT